MRRSVVVGLCVALAAVVAMLVKSTDASDPESHEPANLAFTLKDMDGKDVRLADLKGKPIIVNFWATWCPPCTLEIPQYVDFADKYRSRGLTIVGISIDDTPAELQQFAKEYHMNYPVLVGRDRDDVGDAFGLGAGIPMSVFIRSDGTIAARVEGIRTTDWIDKKIQSLF